MTAPVAAGAATTPAGAMGTADLVTKAGLATRESTGIAAVGATDAKFDMKIGSLDARRDVEFDSAEVRCGAKIGRLDGAIGSERAKVAALDAKLDNSLGSFGARMNADVEQRHRDRTVGLGGTRLVARGVILTAPRFMPHR